MIQHIVEQVVEADGVHEEAPVDALLQAGRDFQHLQAGMIYFVTHDRRHVVGLK